MRNLAHLFKADFRFVEKQGEVYEENFYFTDNDFSDALRFL